MGRCGPGGVRVCLAQQMLGGDRKGGEAMRAKEEKHRVGEGVQGQVGPVLRGRSWLKPQ